MGDDQNPPFHGREAEVREPEKNEPQHPDFWPKWLSCGRLQKGLRFQCRPNSLPAATDCPSIDEFSSDNQFSDFRKKLSLCSSKPSRLRCYRFGVMRWMP